LPFHSKTGTQLFYLNKDEATTPVAFSQDLLKGGVGTNERTDSRPLITQQRVFEKISYDAIQDLMDVVSKPYYNCLKDETTIITDSTAGEFNGFSAVTVTAPEMPLSYQSGTMTAAEAGRHTAIAGSVTAALLNQEAGTEGKHY